MTLLQLAILITLFYFIIRPVYLGIRYAYPARIKIAYFTPTSMGVSYEDVTLRTRDGANLVGWYIPSHNGAAVLLLHSYGVNRLELVDHAETLIRAGYGVMMIDLRAHGASSGRPFGRSQRLVDDLLTAVAWLRKRPDITDAGLGILGIGIGGVFALHAAAKTVAIRAILLDSITMATTDDFPPPTNPIEKIVGWPLQRLFMGVASAIAKLPPIEPNTAVVKRISPRPLLIIASGRGLPNRITQQLFETANQPKTLWQLPEAPYQRSWRTRPDEYAQKMLTFFNRHLRLDMQSLPAEVEEETAVAAQPDALEDLTLSFAWANLIALLMLPVGGVLIWLYFLIWGAFSYDLTTLFAQLGILGILLIFFVSVGVHELLHAVGYTAVGKVAWSDVKFGFSWKGLAPYAHCKAAMTANAYRISVALPGVVLGLLPALYGLATESWGWLLYGIFMLVAAGGDLAVLLALRGVDGRRLVKDHPSEVGCQLLPIDG